MNSPDIDFSQVTGVVLMFAWLLGLIMAVITDRKLLFTGPEGVGFGGGDFKRFRG
jgi:hypothetical protein